MVKMAKLSMVLYLCQILCSLIISRYWLWKMSVDCNNECVYIGRHFSDIEEIMVGDIHQSGTATWHLVIKKIKNNKSQFKWNITKQNSQTQTQFSSFFLPFTNHGLPKVVGYANLTTKKKVGRYSQFR